MEDVVAVAGFFATVIVAIVSFGPVGRAVAESIRRKHMASPGAEVLDQLEDIEARLAGMQQQISDVAERQDFTERLLAKGREPGALGSGGQT